uniref:Glutathione transferase n=1 Tax=Corethron hystrix TaxID=216773 RepID=A0A7S1FRE3_9STRA|mmetsp:Transcript_25252/g.58340  ORF Transcript_25252/g.58340 Transcript_25252/m.58340 type:complete len:283 (+) Transcript_25252:89-937(+)
MTLLSNLQNPRAALAIMLLAAATFAPKASSAATPRDTTTFLVPIGRERPTAVGTGGASTSLSASSVEPVVLFGSQGSRSPLVNWGAYELGVPLRMADDLSANPHPFGQIPCLTDDAGRTVVFESGAILGYLQSKADAGEDGDIGAGRRAEIDSWIAWANASLDPICFLEVDGKVYDTGLKKPNRRVDALDRILAGRQYLLGDGDENFSLADVAVAAYLLYVPQFFRGIDLGRWPNVVRYMGDCASREAYGKAFGPNVQGSLVAALAAMDGGGEEKKKMFGIF